MSKRVSWETLEEILRRSKMHNIEDYKVVKDLRKEVMRLNTKIQVMKDVELEEIERSKKEKEWLAEELIELYERYTTTDMSTEEMKKMLFEDMQQALKGE